MKTPILFLAILVLSQHVNGDEVVQVISEWPGASAEEMEEAVAAPIEQAIRSIGGVQRIETTIHKSECSVLVYSKRNIRRELASAMDQIPNFPARLEQPQIRQAARANSRPLWLLWVPNDEKSLIGILQSEKLRRDIKTQPFVRAVQTFGMQIHFHKVIVDENKLRRFGLTTSQVERSLKDPADFGTVGIDNTSLGSKRIRATVRLKDVAVISAAKKVKQPVFWRGRGISAFRIDLRSIAGRNERLELRDRLKAKFADWKKTLNAKGKFQFAFSEKVANMEVELVNPTKRLERVRPQLKQIASFESQFDALRIETSYFRWLIAVDDPGSFASKTHQSFKAMPGVSGSIRRYPSASSSIQVELTGPELERLRAWNKELARSLLSLDGLCGFQSDGHTLEPELSVTLRPGRAKELGVEIATVAEQLRHLLPSEPEIDPHFPVQLVVSQKNGLNEFAKTSIRTPSGDLVKLTELAEIKMVSVPKQILRINGHRAVAIQVDFTNAEQAELALTRIKALKNKVPGSDYRMRATRDR